MVSDLEEVDCSVEEGVHPWRLMGVSTLGDYWGWRGLKCLDR